MKIIIIIQARMTSTRLPGKVLKTVLEKSLLEYQIERLRRVIFADDIIVATTTNNTDDPIVDLCNRLSVSFFRGSEEDVLSRYFNAADMYNADAIVRITSDCPLIDPVIVDRTIKHFINNYPHFSYVSNCLQRSFPRGMDTEVFSKKALAHAFYNTSLPLDREHVTPYITKSAHPLELGIITHEHDESHHRWTVDTLEDFNLIKNILEAQYPTNPHFSMDDVLQCLSQNPEWFFINAHVVQKHA